MKFPHAHRGVKLIFISEIISIVVSLLALIAAIITSATISNANGGGASTAANVLVLVSSIAGIAVFIIQLVGLFKGAKDCREFRIALWVVLVGVIASLTYAILGSIEATKGLSPVLFAALLTVAALADFFVVLLVLFGISSLASQLGDEDMSDRGHRLATWIIILYIISIVFGFMPGTVVYVSNQGVRVMFSLFGVFASALEIVIYIATLFYLHRATEMLEK